MSDAGWHTPAGAVGLFLRGHTLRTAIPTALVVGTVLCAVNQGATLMAGQVTGGTWVRMVINYLVPFIVASVGYLGARRVRQGELPPREDRRDAESSGMRRRNPHKGANEK